MYHNRKTKPIQILLAFERRRAGLTQKEVTLKLGLSARIVAQWERGTRVPSLEHQKSANLTLTGDP